MLGLLDRWGIAAVDAGKGTTERSHPTCLIIHISAVDDDGNEHDISNPRISNQ